MDEPQDITTTNTYIQNILTDRLKDIEKVFDCNVISAFVPINSPFDTQLRNFLEEIDGKRDSILVILETGGGSIETAERMARVLRIQYSKGEVSFLVPNYAMSAGTVLIMSGDNIYMDYYSVIGPIDPQIRLPNSSRWVPALGYLDKYAELLKKSQDGQLTSAELAFMINKFDPAEIDQFEKARDLSIDLLKQWLVKYKFKNWTVTATNKRPVDQNMKVDRAAQIALKLNDTKIWKSHSRGISMDVARKDLDLIIDDFGEDKARNDAVRAYYRLLTDYLEQRRHSIVLHSRKSFFSI